jgi:enediyne biosynthesis protein E4
VVVTRDSIRRLVPAVVALVCCVVAWQFARPPSVSAADRADLAEGFQFEAFPLGPTDDTATRRVRPVAPVYDHISGWVSSVGAASALFAVDGGAVAHDICLVDPRTDKVTVSPAPGTGERYQQFDLAPTALPYTSYMAPMGCLPADLNEDGWQDVTVYYWGRSPVLFMRVPEAPPSRHAFLARELVTPFQVWSTNAATLADFDGDGHLDLFFGNYFPDGGRVLDETATQPELIMTDSLADGENGGRHHLFRFTSAVGGAEPDARFAAAPEAFADTLAVGWTLATGTQDLNGDGRPDLYIANDFSDDQLLINESTVGEVRFREVHGVRNALTPKSKVVGDDSYKGMGVAFTDLNDDTRPDILVTGITEPFALQESNFAFVNSGDGGAFDRGVAPYDDRSEPLGLSRTGWTWDVKVADFRNDGTPEVMYATGFLRGDTNRWPQMQEAAMSNDLILAHPELWPRFAEGDDLSGHDRNAFFVRGEDGRFVDVADLVGVGTDAVSRSFSVGDVDGDGRLDFLVANQWTQSTFHRNDSTTGQFLGLRLRQPAGVGTCSAGAAAGDRPAIGATATVRYPDGSLRSQQLYPAGGHNGVNAPDLLFGLGEAPAGPLEVEVRWRDACGQRHSATNEFEPGWHQVLLQTDGSTREVK